MKTGSAGPLLKPPLQRHVDNHAAFKALLELPSVALSMESDQSHREAGASGRTGRAAR
jgi:hypothetical protein